MHLPGGGGDVNPPAPFEKFSNLFKPHCKIIEKDLPSPSSLKKKNDPQDHPLIRDM